MNDDFDSEVSDALRRLADSAPQPREDRLEAVVAGVRRRQHRTVGASAVSLVALVAVTTLGVQSWRHATVHNPAPVSSSVDSVTRGPSSSFGSFPSSSSRTPSSGLSSVTSSAGSGPAPSVAPHHTPRASKSGGAGQGELPPAFDLQIPQAAAAGQQIQVTVTVRNPGSVPLAVAQFGIGSRIPTDTFDAIPSTCAPGAGGAYCPVGPLRAGEKESFSFAVTLGWSPDAADQIFANLEYTDSHGQDQSTEASQQITVIESSVEPSIVAPSSGAPSNIAASSSPTARAS
jgi:hypothetical protein